MIVLEVKNLIAIVVAIFVLFSGVLLFTPFAKVFENLTKKHFIVEWFLLMISLIANIFS